mmetsp:Transcript_25026/g.31298  ORF Transcript_25026/g.31298 Transcript_25026/m.31298 type:complete len:98 (-) Transcript_25026:371-664(-)
MKTEAELLAAKQAKPAKAVDPSPDILLCVTYLQESLQKSQSQQMAKLFSNVHGFADADFDMDIDTNFHESESLFFDKLGYIKKDKDADEEEEEESKA